MLLVNTLQKYNIRGGRNAWTCVWPARQGARLEGKLRSREKASAEPAPLEDEVQGDGQSDFDTGTRSESDDF